MYKRKCACGKSEKSFKMDIGPRFVNQCCEEAGYDVLGNPPKSDGQSMEPETPSKDEAPSKEEMPSQDEPKLSKGKLMDMRVAELKDMAKEKGVEDADSMKKKELVKALLD